MQSVLIVIHILIVVALVGVVLLQRSEGGALGTGGNTSNFMTGRGQANALSRATAILGTLYFVSPSRCPYLAVGVMPRTRSLAKHPLLRRRPRRSPPPATFSTS